MESEFQEAAKKAMLDAGRDPGFLPRDKRQLPQTVQDKLEKLNDAFANNELLERVRPDSNLGWWKAAEKKVTDASTSLVGGLKKIGDAITPFENIGKESYYSMMLDKLWPRAAGETKDERGVSVSSRNSLLESTSAEGYAALRANLRNDPALAEQKKQVSLLTRIEQNTKQFTIAASGL
jgi:hypothetical protein